MYKISVIGDKTSIQGFKAVGFDIFEAADAASARQQLESAVSQEYAIIYITEQAAKHCLHEIEAYKDMLLPAIILIPGVDGSLGIGAAGVKKSVERAVGADILGNS